VDLGLRDRVYIVTGGSAGLGFATAQALVADGARVVLSARDPERLTQAARELSAGRSGVVAAVPADNADPRAPGRLIEAATAFGRLDGALISVGGPPAGSAMRVTEDAWRSAFESVFLGAVRLAVETGAKLADAAARPDGTGGAIALVLSSSVRSPISDLVISNGLRPGLAGFAKTLADELGPSGVRVVGLLPGRIRTARLVELGATRGDTASRPSQAIPLRRDGEPEEFGRVAAFVLSPAASYLTGVMIPVDGGALRAW
jgi:3-oxoacyl-[acyl-carrier protein] reductase